MKRYYTPRGQIGTLFCHIQLITRWFLADRRHARNICCITANCRRRHICIRYLFSLGRCKSPHTALAGM